VTFSRNKKQKEIYKNMEEKERIKQEGENTSGGKGY